MVSMLMKVFLLWSLIMILDFSDIDECAESSNLCAQSCSNTIGSYTCSCNAGYTLNAGGRGCDGKSIAGIYNQNFDVSYFIQ